jgi:hypothetical protein
LGYKFSLVLSREISDGEVATLQEAGCASATFTTDSLPTNADVTVTKLDFDDTTSPSLAEAIESALEAVKSVPDLSVPGLTVPAQPAVAGAEESGAVIEGTVIDGVAAEEDPSAEKSTAGKASTGKSGAKRTAAKKASAPSEEEPAAASANGHSSADLVDAAATSD